MKLIYNNIGKLPLDMIVVLLKLLVVESFQDFFNFFKAWAQSQRRSVIVRLLEDFPLRELYQYRRIGSSADVTCFDRFFQISEQLSINDGIFYARFRDVVSGAGNIESHLNVVDGLAATGEFLYLVGKCIIRILYHEKDTSVSTLQYLTAVRCHPYYPRAISQALCHLKTINSSVVMFKGAAEINFHASCPLHRMDVNLLPPNKFGLTGECLFCNIAAMLNVFHTNGG